MADHNELFADIRSGLARFEARVDSRFDAMDTRFGRVETRLDAGVAEMAAIRRDMTAQFRWTAGIMLTGLIAIAAAIVAAIVTR